MPLTRSGVVLSRSLNGDVPTVGVSGRLYKSKLLLYDHQTESLWSRLMHRAVAGLSFGHHRVRRINRYRIGDTMPRLAGGVAMDLRLVYMTAGSREEAAAIGRRLVETGLAACVNIIDPMMSIYRWNGALQEDTEVVMIAKTTADRVPELTATVVDQHSYDCPCVVTIPIDGGHSEFLQWVASEVTKQP